MTSEVIYRFGPFAADRTTYRVREGARVLDLSPKLLDLLFYFLERPATLVTKEALLAGVWPGANVTDNAVAQAISELRDAIRDDPSAPTYIRTVARRGYRFIAEVETGPATRSAAIATQVPEVSGRSADEASAIAVLDFTNVALDPEIAWLGPAIAETVTSDLAAIEGLRVVDRWRVVDAHRRTDGTLGELASALDVTHVVTGSYQRSGSQLRITARIAHLQSGEAIADAKVDGPLDEVFALQDRIAGDFARGLGLPAGPAPARPGVRETASLDAYRAVIEGNLKIESLDTAQVRASIADFEHAIAIDPRYAIAYTGLANAELVAYEMTKLMPAPDHQALSSGIEHARHALKLDDRLAEAHGTLSFLLTSAARFDEARAAAHRAVALDPENWRHHYRLAHASWGEARLRACARTLGLYPQFAYAALETAFVHVARGDFDAADEIVRRGVTGQNRGDGDDRFPAAGFHWLRGLLRTARGDLDGATAEFDRELAHANPRRLYGPEYAAAALVGRGQAELAQGLPDSAVQSFRQAFVHVRDLPQAHLGLAAAFDRLTDAHAARTARQAARLGIEAFRRPNREHDALLLEACDAAIEGTLPGATATLEDLVASGPPSYFGWMIPVEPFLRPLHGTAPFGAILRRLAERAR